MQSNPLTHALIVDLAENSAAIVYGAAGFLYGLGNDGIPSVNMLAPLKPRVAAQKPPGGAQHPNGDALDVSNTYLAAGGREIEIYLQDIYANWPYESLGLDDYLARIKPLIQQVMASPNHTLFSYVPFNEPDQIWYNKDDKKAAFFADWKTVYETIKAIDPQARIVGPNLADYDSRFYRDFMTFALANACLPDVTSWHELNDAFFSGWYQRYDDYRAIERDLGMAAKEICINEYARISGDLGIPGRLVQWIARFEASKVDACLAYWTSAGCLNDLVAQDSYNQATGGWWLYKWYASLTGSTVKVSPPDAYAEGLQGVAALDDAKKQVRILFGGASGSTDLLIQGFDATAFFGEQVHVTVWATPSTGTHPSPGPGLVLEGVYPVFNGQVSVSVNDMLDTTAYQMIIAPQQGTSPAASPGVYEAQYADIAGSARIAYGGPGSSGKGFVEGYAGSDTASTSFTVTAQEDGFYDVRLNYSAGPLDNSAGPLSDAPADRMLRVMLNGARLCDLSLPVTADWDTWTNRTLTVFLTGGINRIAFEAFTGDHRSALQIGHIELTPGNGAIQTYQAGAKENMLAGTVTLMEDPAAPGGKYAGNIGGGADNYLQFNNVTAAESGTYRMVVSFANAEFRGGHAYNSQVVDRYAEISVNGNAARKVYFRNTFAWDHYQTRVVDVELQSGRNTIRFFNSGGDSYAPNIDKIAIASTLTAR